MEQQQVSLVLIVPTKYVGLIIGKNGTFSKKILNGTQAQLVFQLKGDMPENNQERAMAIFGENKEIFVVIDRIFEHIDNSMKETSNPCDYYQSTVLNEADNEIIDVCGTSEHEYLAKCLISQSVCGTLIGKGGDGIKAIHRISGAWVKVAHTDEFSNSNAER